MDEGQKQKINKAVSFLSLLDSAFVFISENRESLAAILGDERPMHYLILNQNRDELRANGGFP